MTTLGSDIHTAIGLRVTLLRVDALGYTRHPAQGAVTLCTLHDALGLLDEFCSVVNLASLLEEGRADEEVRATFESTHPLRDDGPDHAEVLVRLDSDIRSLVAPVVRRISMGSPLTIELIGSLTTGALFLLKNPAMIGRWVPTVREHWFQAEAEAERAKRAYRALTQAGIEVEELES
jgi:hypothetical protein